MKFSDKTDDELGAIVRVGADTVAFLKSEFYVKHLKPQIELERAAAKNNGDWFPGKTTDCEGIAITNAFNSGLREGLRALDATMGQLIRDANEANKEIKYRAEKAGKRDGK